MKLVTLSQECGTPETEEEFAQLRSDRLEAFIRVRVNKGTELPPKDDERRPPKTKGTVEEAKMGKDNLIARAFKVKDKEVIIEKPSTPSPKSPVSNTRHQEATIVSVSPRQNRFSSDERASKFLEDEVWFHKVRNTLDPCGKHVPSDC